MISQPGLLGFRLNGWVSVLDVGAYFSLQVHPWEQILSPNLAMTEECIGDVAGPETPGDIVNHRGRSFLVEQVVSRIA